MSSSMSIFVSDMLWCRRGSGMWWSGLMKGVTCCHFTDVVVDYDHCEMFSRVWNLNLKL